MPTSPNPQPPPPAPMGTTPAALAIARMEGYAVPGSRAVRNNNPGNIWDGLGNGKTRRLWPGYNIDDKGFVIFPTAQIGWTELERQLRIKANRGLTLGEAITQWAPPVENDTAAYIRNMETWTGYAADTPLTAVLDGSAAGRIINAGTQPPASAPGDVDGVNTYAPGNGPDINATAPGDGDLESLASMGAGVGVGVPAIFPDSWGWWPYVVIAGVVVWYWWRESD